MPEHVPISLLRSDTFLDAVLGELSVRAGHPRHTTELGMARWDLKAALLGTIERVYADVAPDATGR